MFARNIPGGGAATMPDVQRACGIGADKFYLDLPALAQSLSPVALSLTHNFLEHDFPGRSCNEKVDEARPGDFDFFHNLVGIFKVSNDLLGNFPGVAFQDTCKAQGDIAGIVPCAATLGMPNSKAGHADSRGMSLIRGAMAFSSICSIRLRMSDMLKVPSCHGIGNGQGPASTDKSEDAWTSALSPGGANPI